MVLKAKQIVNKGAGLLDKFLIGISLTDQRNQYSSKKTDTYKSLLPSTPLGLLYQIDTSCIAQ